MQGWQTNLKGENTLSAYLYEIHKLVEKNKYVINIDTGTSADFSTYNITNLGKMRESLVLILVS